jgi:hypothetical protein
MAQHEVRTHLDRLPNDVIEVIYQKVEVIYQKEVRLRMVHVLEELLPAVEAWDFKCFNRRISIFDKLQTFVKKRGLQLGDSKFWAQYWQHRCLDDRRLFLIYLQQFEREGLLLIPRLSDVKKVPLPDR